MPFLGINHDHAAKTVSLIPHLEPLVAALGELHEDMENQPWNFDYLWIDMGGEG
jgi:hypothetical protein